MNIKDKEQVRGLYNLTLHQLNNVMQEDNETKKIKGLEIQIDNFKTLVEMLLNEQLYCNNRCSLSDKK